MSIIFLIKLASISSYLMSLFVAFLYLKWEEMGEIHKHLLNVGQALETSTTYFYQLHYHFMLTHVCFISPLNAFLPSEQKTLTLVSLLFRVWYINKLASSSTKLACEMLQMIVGFPECLTAAWTTGLTSRVGLQPGERNHQSFFLSQTYPAWVTRHQLLLFYSIQVKLKCIEKRFSK